MQMRTHGSQPVQYMREEESFMIVKSAIVQTCMQMDADARLRMESTRNEDKYRDIEYQIPLRNGPFYNTENSTGRPATPAQ